MADFNNTTVTLAGRKALAETMANKTKLKFTRVEIGDGQAPYAPETLTGLVNKTNDLPVSTVFTPVDGVIMVRATIRHTDILAGFYLREVGVIAQLDDGREILFSYANAGEQGDYMAASNGTTYMEKSFNLSLVVGDAQVAILPFDPNAAITMQELNDIIAELNIDAIRESIKEANDALDVIKQDLADNAESYIKKTGDDVTGDINMIGDAKLNGTATKWADWYHFDSFEQLNAYIEEPLDSTTSFIDIANNMPAKSKFTAFIGIKTPHYPAIGLLEINRGPYMTTAMFTAPDGRTWKSSIHNGTWTGWGGSIETPPGIVHASISSKIPLGYIALMGQEIDYASYPALCEACDDVLKPYQNAQGKTVVKLPDLRGLFIRGLDNGAGIDLNRAILSVQESGAPNITGFVSGGAVWFDRTEGAFKHEGLDGRKSAADGTTLIADDFSFDASRVSSVYKNNLKEIRVRNIALNYILKY